MKKKSVTSLTMTFTLLFVVSNYASSEWVLQNPAVTGNTLLDVFFVTRSCGWACGRFGTIIHSHDSGATWQAQKTPKNNHIRSIFFHNESEGWAVGGVVGRSYLLHTEDGGNEWREYENDIPEGVLRKVTFCSRQKGWIVGPANYLSVTKDGGKTWNTREMDEYLGDISFFNDSIGFLCGNHDYIAKTVDGGETWKKEKVRAGFDEPIIKIKVDSWMYDNTRYIYGSCLTSQGNVYSGIEGALGWAYHFDNRLLPVTDFLIPNEHRIILFGGAYPASTFIYDTHPDFLKVHNRFYGTGIDYGISGTQLFNDQTGIAVGGVGCVYEIGCLSDSVCLKLRSKGNGVSISCIDFGDTLHGCAGTFNGKLFITDNGGKTWVKKNSALRHAISEVLYFDQHNISVFYADGSMAHSINQGKEWTLTEFSSQCKNGKKLSQDGSGYIWCSDSLLFTTSKGQEWEFCCSVGDFGNLRAAQFFNKETGIVTVTANQPEYGHTTLLKTINGGTTWDTLALQTSMYVRDIHFVNDSTGWMCGSFSAGALPVEQRIYKTTDGGESWSQQDNVSFQQNFYIPARDTSWAYEFQRIVSADGQNVWALHEQGIHFSNSGGNSWMESSLPEKPFMLYDMCFLDNNNVWVAGDGASIWKLQQPSLLNKPFESIRREGTFDILFSQDNFIIELHNDADLQYSVYTLSGRRIAGFNVPGTKGKNLLLPHLYISTPGVYLFVISINGQTESFRFTTNGTTGQ